MSAGYFSIANNNGVVIDGGVLMQMASSAPMLVGDGAGSGPKGTLRIDNAGLLDTGGAFALIIGGSLSGDLLGNGTVNVSSGTLRLGIGATLLDGGLGVGLDQSTGNLAIGDALGSAGSALVDLTANGTALGARLAIGSSALGTIGGHGSVTIERDGKLLQGTGTAFVGEAGGTGALTIKAGGQLVSAGGDLHVGDFQSATGTFISSGTVTGIRELIVGIATATGNAALSGGMFQAQRALIGRGSGGLGTLTVGDNTTAVFSERVEIGDGGTGTVTLSGGVLETGYLVAGAGAVTLSVGGGTLRAHGNEPDFLRGFSGAGEVDFYEVGAFIDSKGFDLAITAGNILGGTALTKVGLGSLTINATQNYAAFTASGGTTFLDSPLGSGNSTANANANATLVFRASQRLEALNIGSAGLAGLSAAAIAAQPIPEPNVSLAWIMGALTWCAASRRKDRRARP